MRSSSIALLVGLFAAPLALLTSPGSGTAPAGLMQTASAQPLGGVPNTVNGRPLEPAPVPGIGPAGVSPADRVAGAGGRSTDAGPQNGTPFSSTPSGTLPSGNSETHSADAADTDGGSPNLSR